MTWGVQFEAFKDTWRWSEAIDDFDAVARNVKLASMIEGSRKILGEGSSLAYLSYMANRLRECRRVLKSTGTIYLHCDPTMSHYLKLVMDAVFGVKHFQNEIVWCYSHGGRSQKGFGKKHDVILRYTKSTKFVFNKNDVRIPMTPHKRNRTGTHYGGKIGQDEHGRVFVDKQGSRDSTGRYKHYRYYLDKGKIPEDWWIDINSLQASSRERQVYATQKPRKLIERMILASSCQGDTVLDPFCGYGTTVAADQHLNRQWIGIDVCHRAYKIIEERLLSEFQFEKKIDFIGMPKTLDAARALAQ